MLFLAQTGLALDLQPRNRTTFSSPFTGTGTGPGRALACCTHDFHPPPGELGLAS